jgi:hypothetical protein
MELSAGAGGLVFVFQAGILAQVQVVAQTASGGDSSRAVLLLAIWN